MTFDAKFNADVQNLSQVGEVYKASFNNAGVTQVTQLIGKLLTGVTQNPLGFITLVYHR